MTEDEVQYLLAAPNATAGYQLPGTVYNSNGRYCSTTQIDLEVSFNNLFPDLTGVQNAAQQVDYQCVFIYNSDTVTTMVGSQVWIPTASVTSASITWAFALDPTGVTNYNNPYPQSLLISSPYIAPAGVTNWASPSASVSGALSAGNIGPRQVYAVWVRRTATGTPGDSQFNLQVTFNVNA
jgi:hypothetical protein